MQTGKTLENSDKQELDAVRFYDSLDCLLQDLDTSRILHILPTRGSLSFQHRSTRYNVTDKDYVILPNAALSRDFASSADFEALMFSLSPDCANQFVLRSNYGIIGHMALLQNPVMRPDHDLPFVITQGESDILLLVHQIPPVSGNFELKIRLAVFLFDSLLELLKIMLIVFEEYRHRQQTSREKF